MAKKSTKSGVVRRKTKAAEVPVIKAVEPVKKPNNMFMVILAVFVIFTVAEIFFITAKNARESKRPFYVDSWPHNYKGSTSIGEYGNYLYALDNTRGDAYKTDKATGVMVKIFSFPVGLWSFMENSKGEMYVLTKTNEVLVLDPKTYKTVQTIQLEGIKDGLWMDVDSKDNFYIVGSTTGYITKFGPGFKKILSFGGRGDEKGSMSGPSKVFVGPKDDLYVMNSYAPGKLEVKIYDENGKFLRSWPITKIKKLTNMAVAADGNVYVNSYEESKIFVFSPTGKFLSSFDGDKDKKFQIMYAASLTGGKNGLIYVHTHKMGIFKTINY
jgi:hypothetical protein